MKDTKEILETIVPIHEYGYDQVKVGKILYTIITNLNYQRANIEEARKKDEKEYCTNIDTEKLYKIVQEYYQKPLPMLQEKVDKKQTDGWGTIGVMYQGEVEVTLRLALMALRTHNNIVFFVEENRRINHLIIKTIQDTIRECEYTNCIYEVEGYKEELVENQSFLDLSLLIGNKQEYQRMKSKLNIPLLYHGYGNVCIYADDVYFKEVLANIDLYVYHHNIHLQYFHQNDIQLDLQEINQMPMNDCVAIFTKDFKKAYDFISKVKAKKVYVNVNPFIDYTFTLDETDFILEKQIVIQK